MATESPNEQHESFDEVTLEKLDIYSRYLQQWLPRPLSGQACVEEAGIYDLFCGSGCCADGSDGSPLRAVSVLRANERSITCGCDVNVRLVFNDIDPTCVKSLAGRLGPQVLARDGQCLAHIQYYSQPCGELLQSLLPKLQKSRAANLLFIDQCGLSEPSEEQLRKLRALRGTDLLIFISSSWFRRFAKTKEAEHWAMEKSDIEVLSYNRIHRFMASYFRSVLGSGYFVAPFSLKRQCELYGLIFASHNPLGLEKFLEVAWHRDPYTGETNFDLYEDGTSRVRLALLDARKICEFQKELMICLESGKFTTDRDIYLHVLQRGFLGRHAADTIKAFCCRRNVKFKTRAGKLGRPRLSQGCFRNPRPMVYN